MPPAADPRLLVIGPGALGCLFAARLGRRHAGVYLLDHRADRAARLQEQGLHVTGATHADWTPPPGRVRADARGWPKMDAVLVFVKAPALAAALKAAAPALGPKTVLVLFPEAVDPAALKGGPKRLWVPALTDERARVEGPGRVFHEAAGQTRLDARAPQAAALLPLFRAAHVPCVLDKKTGDRRWLTRLAQVCVDVPAALTDAPQKAVLAPPLQGVADRLLAECAALSRALKRPVTPAALKGRREELIQKAPDAKSPLGRDLLRGRPTERAALLDPLLAAARRAKTPAPTLDALDRLLRRLEKEGPPA